MYKNIGGKIKILSQILAVAGALISVCFAVIFLSNDIIGLGFLTMLFGPAIAWASSFVLYGFGHLIENTDKMVGNNNNIEAKGNELVEEKPKKKVVACEDVVVEVKEIVKQEPKVKVVKEPKVKKEKTKKDVKKIVEMTCMVVLPAVLVVGLIFSILPLSKYIDSTALCSIAFYVALILFVTAYLCNKKETVFLILIILVFVASLISIAGGILGWENSVIKGTRIVKGNLIKYNEYHVAWEYWVAIVMGCLSAIASALMFVFKFKKKKKIEV